MTIARPSEVELRPGRDMYTAPGPPGPENAAVTDLLQPRGGALARQRAEFARKLGVVMPVTVAAPSRHDDVRVNSRQDARRSQHRLRAQSGRVRPLLLKPHRRRETSDERHRRLGPRFPRN